MEAESDSHKPRSTWFYKATIRNKCKNLKPTYLIACDTKLFAVDLLQKFSECYRYLIDVSTSEANCLSISHCSEPRWWLAGRRNINVISWAFKSPTENGNATARRARDMVWQSGLSSIRHRLCC